MKTLRFMLAAAAAIFLAASCNPEEKIDPNASNERSILSIKLQGQVGEEAVPEIIDESNGRVNVEISTVICTDLSKVKVEELTISYKAKASVQVGETIDLSSGIAEIIITAESGKTRTYKIYSDSFSESFVGKYAVKNTAFLGGVGDPTYGGVEIIDPIEYKSWLFTASDAEGVGPAASNDDYFEITLDKVNPDGSTEGTCVLYGGVDGKHWNCLYKTEYDLSDKLRVIPIGTSHWKRTYDSTKGSKIIFYDSEGAVTDTCTILTATKDLYVNKEGITRSFVLENGQLGLEFLLDGDRSWTDEYASDVTRFVRSPLALYIRIERVEEIPEESKTQGTTGNVTVVGPDPVDPVDPEPEPEPVDLQGTFKVKSLQLLASPGSGSAVEIKEKSWMWNSTVNNEYDNELIINPTGMTGTTVTAQVYYGAGADGAFWDHTLLAEKNRLGTGAMDLSANFDQLPHGVSTATISLSDGSVTIGNLSVSAMMPGTHTINIDNLFSNVELKVPANCIAVAIPCTQYPEDQYTMGDGWAYTDFDRFALRPYVYYMIFEKVSEDVTFPEEPGDDPDPAEIAAALTGTYKVTNLQMLGGAYANSFVEFEKKASSFSSSLTNEYDNKLILIPTGMNGDAVTASVTYAPGDDNKYWDYKLLGSANPLGDDDYDMSANLKRLPHATAEATLNLETGDFTIASTSGKALLPGEYPYDFSSAGGGKGTITVPEGSIGIAFQCTQYPTSEYTFNNDWLYKDGDRFMLHPIIYAMIFKKESSDTTIPTIPEEGGDEPTDDGISGTYKVKSLMHVGGNWCNSAINLADKKICFNSSFDTEYDNLLVVQATGAADGNVSVSLDYQAGADNGYWDGKFVAQYNKIDTSTDMDLSHDLCALPHGKSTGLIDTSNGTLTIGTAAFKLATPGSYDLERSSTGTKGTITVPDGCIGLFIPCKGYQGEYTYDSNWNYSTFDRVACHPYIYAMIFEKK